MRNRRVLSALVGLFMMGMTTSAFAWSPELEGSPDDFHMGKNQGYFIWHDDAGLHLRTTTKGQNHVYTGVLRTDGRFVNVHGVRLENDDRYKITSFGHKLEFRFETIGASDGIDFRVDGGDKVDFDLFVDGHKISPKKIYGGEDNWHPRSNSFKIVR